MKICRILIVLFLNISVGFSQIKTLSGEVRNMVSDEPLPYVNIGIENKGVGTVSNKNGIFKLRLSDHVSATDSVIFSFIGFKTKKYSIEELTNSSDPILMSDEHMELNEVVLHSEKVVLKPKKIGRASKGLGLMHANFYTYNEKDVDDRLSKERGMKFKIKSNCFIESLHMMITSNDFTSLKFRINFYKIENGLPTDLIVEQNIIFEIRDSYLGWYEIDLEPYKILLKEDIEEVAVTIQWLESVKENEKSKYFALATASSATHTAFFREKAMDSWQKGGQNLSFYLSAMCE